MTASIPLRKISSEKFKNTVFDKHEENVDLEKYSDLDSWNKENKQLILDTIEKFKEARTK